MRMRHRNLSTSTAAAAAVQAKMPASSRSNASGSLSSLLLSNGDTAKYLQPNAPKLRKHYEKIAPNDYWKSMREWDFLKELNDKQQNNNGNPRHKGNNGKRKHNDIGGNKAATSNEPPPTPSDDPTERAAVLVNGSSENIGVQIRSVLTENYRDRTFIANDIVLLARKESCVWDACKGALVQRQQKQRQGRSQVRQGIVGHIEYTRRSMEGMTIQVSRKLWTEVGSTAEMVLLKLGCNITALREFTALCRMDTIPLLDYILGEKMSSSSKKKESSAAAQHGFPMDEQDPLVKEKRAKKEVISNMGGSSALGKGFAQFASQKFNLSQLGAISASATEYGDGGFTLIKGPPGTGKTTTLCALLNALHIRQMNQYFEEVKQLAQSYDAVVGKRASLSLSGATKKRPRMLVCAPNNKNSDICN